VASNDAPDPPGLRHSQLSGFSLCWEKLRRWRGEPSGIATLASQGSGRGAANDAGGSADDDPGL
jgi:hypothetical protein